MYLEGEALVLTREIAALKLQRAGDSVGALYQIPARCVVRPLGAWQSTAKVKMVKIDWQGEWYAVFKEDLEVRAVPRREFADYDQQYG